MFNKTARFYDAVYSDKDYPAESRGIAEVIRSRNTAASTLLDVACGTGKHLEYLVAGGWDCDGVDLDSAMIEIARERVPGVPLHEADMVTLDLGEKRFDAVVCMFSSIGYTQTVDRMNKAVTAMAAHLNPGGVLVVEPWITPESWIVGHADMVVVDEPDYKLARIGVSEPVERGRLVLEYLLGTPDGVERLREEHQLGWFTHDEYMAAVDAAGLAAEHIPGHDDNGRPFRRGMYIGMAPDS